MTISLSHCMAMRIPNVLHLRQNNSIANLARNYMCDMKKNQFLTFFLTHKSYMYKSFQIWIDAIIYDSYKLKNNMYYLVFHERLMDQNLVISYSHNCSKNILVR